MQHIHQGGWISFNDEAGFKVMIRACCIMEVRGISENKVLVTTTDGNNRREYPGDMDSWMQSIERAMGNHINQRFELNI